MRRVALAAFLALLVVGLAAQEAAATFPGSNGKIAFNSDRTGDADVWVMNPDGGGQTRIQSDGVEDFYTPAPAWAPSGREIAFTHDYRQDGTHRADIFVMEADGASVRPLGAGGGNDTDPTWSPDGSRIAHTDGARVVVRDLNGDNRFAIPSDGDPETYDFGADWSPDGDLIAFVRLHLTCPPPVCPPSTMRIYLFDPDQGEAVPLNAGDSSSIDTQPSFSPDGQTILFLSDRAGPDRSDLYTVPVGGGTATPVTDTPFMEETQPVWSPDGTKIAFTGRAQNQSTFDIYAMNADGTGRVQLTTNPANDSEATWQRVAPLPGFPRPKSAVSMRLPLVPAYVRCTTPNRSHGPPLAFGSCNPPVQSSDLATFGTPDANGFPAGSTGSVGLAVQSGNPATPADDADVRMTLSLTDVRQLGSPAADLQGSVVARFPMHLTDKDNGCCEFPSTMRDPLPLYLEAPCSPNPDPAVGSTCSATTTADAVIPGMVREGVRAIWEAREPVKVYDEGGTVLATQGVFVP